MAGVVERLKALALRVWSPALIAYGLSGAVAVASFAATLILARMSGPTVIGQYAVAVATANLMVVFSLQGLDRVAIREVAGDLREGDEGRARATIRLLLRHTGMLSLAASALWLLLLYTTRLNEWIGGNWWAMLAVPLLVPAIVFLRGCVASIRATNAPLRGQFAESLPTLLFPLLLFPLWLLGYAPGAGTAAGLLVVMNIVAGIAALAILRAIIRGWSHDGAPLPPGLRTAGLALMSTQFIQVFTDWFILVQLSAHASPADVGAFRVALQIITIFLTIITTSEAYVAARVAGDFRVGRADLAWRRHRRATVLMLATASPLLLACLLAPKLLLGKAFGPEFAVASTALAIMAGVQILHVGRGPIGAMFSMARRDDVQLKMTIVAGLAGGLVSLFLIPRYGLTGAALAQGVPLIIRGIVSVFFARRLLPRAPGPPSDL